MKTEDEKTMKLAAALWETRPVSGEIPEPFPENRTMDLMLSQEGYGVGARMIGASVRGKKHRHSGVNCDDWFEIAEDEGKTIAALADGAGSCLYSRIGAKEACRGAVRGVKAALSRQQEPDREACTRQRRFERRCCEIGQALLEGTKEARRSVEEAFRMRAADPRYSDFAGREIVLDDFASTLLIALTVPVMEDGESLLLTGVCQIGDGAAVLIDSRAEGGVRVLGAGDHGIYAGETEFLTSDMRMDQNSLMRRVRITSGSFTELILTSDGVADDYFPEQSEFLQLWRDLRKNGILPNRQNATEILELDFADKTEEGGAVQRLERWLFQYERRGSFDDRTLVVLSLGSGRKDAEMSRKKGGD